MKHNIQHSFFYFSFFLFMHIVTSTAQANTFNVGFSSVFIPALQGTSYINTCLWYPTAKNPSSQSIGTETGEKFLIGNNAEPLPTEMEFILISPSTMADRFSFSKLAFLLAQEGYFVAVLTHNQDNRNNMSNTLTPMEYPQRAMELKSSADYLYKKYAHVLKNPKFTLISFDHTALAPLLMHNGTLSSELLKGYCPTYNDDFLCAEPYYSQMLQLGFAIDDEKNGKNNAYIEFQLNTQNIEKQNAELKTKYEKEKATAERRKQELPFEPEYLSLPIAPFEFDVYYPKIENLILINPSFVFLLDIKELEEVPAVFALFSENETLHFLGQNTLLFTYFPHLKTEIMENMETTNLMEPCLPEIASFLPEICPQIDTSQQEDFLNQLVLQILTFIQ